MDEIIVMLLQSSSALLSYVFVAQATYQHTLPVPLNWEDAPSDPTV